MHRVINCQRIQNKLVLHQMDQFPNEITTQILSRLPVKYVLRCRSVCKTWKNIIDDRQRFAPLHYTRSLEEEEEATHHNKSTLIFVSTGNPHPIYIVELKQESQQQQHIFKASQIDFWGPGFKTIYANSCHGLLCFYTQELNYTYIHNPATHEFFELPSSPLSPESNKDVNLGDTLPPPYVHAIGFGYDHSSKAFKVLQIVYMIWDLSDLCFVKPVRAQVCTLGSNSWRKLENFPCVSCFGRKPALINGALHWLSDKHILSFDLASENFGSVQYPHSNFIPFFYFEFESEYNFQLVALDACLSIAHLSSDEDFELWIMKDYNVKESWIKLIIKRRYGVFQNVFPICIWKNDELLLLYGSNILVSYGIQSGTYTPFEIEDLPAYHFKPFTHFHGYEVYPYVGNLMSIEPADQWKRNHEEGRNCKKEFL
ncbi:F-box protein [Thalictrum thalictroides]|uniref:F-box protein n=1 Tax=Thalictrum thalictroides TaxID=46969 RepID=A0A7J6VSN9_THATH|nr:F-box protein [Thalictrum thalictroides]